MFADRVYALTVEACLEMKRGNLLDSLAVPAFLKGTRDRSAAQEALAFSNPSTIRAAVGTVLHVQSAARTLGVRGMSARHVAFEDEPTVISPEALSEITVVDRAIRGVVRQLQQCTISPKVGATPTSGTCFTCRGRGHRARDCANKRRRSPFPLTCFECSGKGHLARECSNTVRRRDPPAKPPNRRHRRWSNTSSGSSSSTDSVETHAYRRGHRRHSPGRRRSHRKCNHQCDGKDSHNNDCEYRSDRGERSHRGQNKDHDNSAMKDSVRSQSKYHSRDQTKYDYSRSPRPSLRNMAVQSARRGGGLDKSPSN